MMTQEITSLVPTYSHIIPEPRIVLPARELEISREDLVKYFTSISEHETTRKKPRKKKS